MSLDAGVADLVVFECEKCGREHALRKIRKYEGVCSKCQSNVWTMTTEYQESEQTHAFLLTLAAVLFGHSVFGIVRRIQQTDDALQTVRIVTPTVPAEEAVQIARAGFFKYRKWAYKYMELRRQLDGERERQVMREHGGRNCAICNMFFMPAPEKPWTQAGYCSRACATTAGVPVELAAKPPPPKEVTPRTPAPRALKVACTCGHSFDVPAIYTGTLRPCPLCQKKMMVP